MNDKLKIGIIGAGHISNRHLAGYASNPHVELYAICDVNPEAAQGQADAYHIPVVYSDYKVLLQDAQIDAVSIVTPTFTHKDIVIEALRSGKHVLCEKPPARNVAEAEACLQAAKESGKLLMYAFVVRFTSLVLFLKDYVDSGAMGKINYAEISRMNRCAMMGSWFVDKEKSGGGCLIDGAIHQLDTALYLMGFPKVKSVRGFQSFANGDLPSLIRGRGPCPPAAVRTVESFANGYILFENGACMYIKSGYVSNAPETGTGLTLSGEAAGAKLTLDSVELVTLDPSGYFMKSSPALVADSDHFQREIDHFVDCCTNKAECICTPEQAVEVMRIISAIYESAETGREILF